MATETTKQLNYLKTEKGFSVRMLAEALEVQSFEQVRRWLRGESQPIDERKEKIHQLWLSNQKGAE